MFEMAFACLAGTEAQARQSLLLVQSLRAFGGSLAASPMMALVPVAGVLDAEIDAGLRACDVDVVPFAVPEALEEMPLSERAASAAQAEIAAQDVARLLVWLDSDTLILREPSGLRIPAEARIGCRPVDLCLIGSPWEEEPDAFWKAIYAGCGVEPDRVFPVNTMVEGEAIRAYFNAGCLVVRPQARLLRRWLAAILSLEGREKFRALTGRQKLFFHQAVLAGTLLAALRREEIAVLPPTVNYPLHLHHRVPADRRPTSLREVESCRYESVFELGDWDSRLPLDGELRSWLEARRELARGD
jgi:hypothetical protein